MKYGSFQGTSSCGNNLNILWRKLVTWKASKTSPAPAPARQKKKKTKKKRLGSRGSTEPRPSWKWSRRSSYFEDLWRSKPMNEICVNSSRWRLNLRAWLQSCLIADLSINQQVWKNELHFQIHGEAIEISIFWTTKLQELILGLAQKCLISIMNSYEFHQLVHFEDPLHPIPSSTPHHIASVAASRSAAASGCRSCSGSSNSSCRCSQGQFSYWIAKQPLTATQLPYTLPF